MTEIVYPDSAGFSKASIAELGAKLRNAGMVDASVRGFVDQVQGVAEQVTLIMTPILLDSLRNINQAQLAEVSDRIQRLPTKLGYIDRTQVLMILHNLLNAQPGR